MHDCMQSISMNDGDSKDSDSDRDKDCYYIKLDR